MQKSKQQRAKHDLRRPETQLRRCKGPLSKAAIARGRKQGARIFGTTALGQGFGARNGRALEAISDKSTSSPEQNGTKTDTSSNDEGEIIAETPPGRLAGVPRLKRENAFKVTEFSARKK